MTARSKGTSRRISPALIGILAISAVTPSTKAILAIFEPMALPTPIAGMPFNAASAETIISGADVPKATTVRPIIMGVMPTCFATEALPLTNKLALQTRPIKPMISDRRARTGSDIKLYLDYSGLIDDFKSILLVIECSNIPQICLVFCLCGLSPRHEKIITVFT